MAYIGIQHNEIIQQERNSADTNYNLEGFPVSYTMKDFQRDYVKNHMGLLSPDEVLDSFSPDEVLQRFSLDDRLKGISPEEIELYLQKHGKKKGQ